MNIKIIKAFIMTVGNINIIMTVSIINIRIKNIYKNKLKISFLMLSRALRVQFSKVARGEHVIGIDLGTTNSCVAMMEG